MCLHECACGLTWIRLHFLSPLPGRCEQVFVVEVPANQQVQHSNERPKPSREGVVCPAQSQVQIAGPSARGSACKTLRHPDRRGLRGLDHAFPEIPSSRVGCVEASARDGSSRDWCFFVSSGRDKPCGGIDSESSIERPDLSLCRGF